MVAKNKPEREWLIREYREGDEEQILKLQGIVMSDSKDKQWWQWMYRDGPLGPARIFVVEAKQRIIGHTAMIFVPIKIRDQVTRSTHGVDLMVHPDYRRQGLFITLHTNLLGAVSARRGGISYGTPNDQSRPGFVKRLSLMEICEVPRLLKVVDWGIVLKSRYRIPVFIGKLLGSAWERMTGCVSLGKDIGIEIEEVFSFDERIDKFWEKASKMKDIMVIKDMKYLNWRYVAKPGKEYKILIAKKQQEIVGYTVLKVEKNVPPRGYIVDLLIVPGESRVAEALITRAIRHLKEDGAATVSCWMLPDTPYYRTLKKLGFVRRTGPLLCARIFDPNIPKEFVTNAANWYYAMGDGDVL